MAARFHTFAEGVHYRLAGTRLVWVNATERPDNGKRVDVEFTVREAPPGLTDFNQGSVVGTLVRAISREMAQLYAQMDEAYRRAFIDHATGAGLDNVVALLGVTRVKAQPAEGEVTFFRKTPAPAPIAIAAGTRVMDAAGRVFLTTGAGVIPAVVPVDELPLPSGGAVRTTKPIAELRGVWLATDDPDTVAPLPVRAGFGADFQTVTFDPAGGAPPGAQVRVRYVPRAATVFVRAQEPGPSGNVNAGTITVMPTPPPGVDGVTNERPLGGGQVAESDERLRDRARHALERAGNATLNAIKFTVLGVDGVEGVDVIDHTMDDAIPLGEVRVRYPGGRVEDVRRAVESSRAAGILARLEQIQPVLVSGRFLLLPGTPPPGPGAAAAFLARVVDLMKAMPIGAPLALRRLGAVAFDIPGIAEVAEAQLTATRTDGTSAPVPDPLLIAPSEIIRPDVAALDAAFLARLTAPGSAPGAGGLDITVQILDATGAAVAFRAFAIDLSVNVRAFLLSAPESPPERIASLAKRAEFGNGASATIAISSADLAGFRPADHDPTLEWTITAPGFPGLQGVTRRIAVT
jgi:hypothetical protein